MATINYTAPDGSQHKIPLPEGADAAQTVTQFETAQGFTAVEGKSNFGRNVGLSSRGIVGGLSKFGPMLSDIVAGVINLPLAAGDMLAEPLRERGIPVASFRVPTNLTERADEALSIVGFPEPETPGERIAVLANELAVPGLGVSGGAVKASRAPSAIALARNAAKSEKVVKRGLAEGEGVVAPETSGILRGLGDEIAEFFTGGAAAGTSKTKDVLTAVRASTAEAGGATGAAAARVISEEEEFGPLAQFATETVGGLALGAAPSAVTSVGRRAATKALDFGSNRGAFRRAAIALQESVDDPTALAKKVRDAPDDVLPATATGDPVLQAQENLVARQDPGFARKLDQSIAKVESRNLAELTTLATGSDPGDFQHIVVQSIAPEGVTVAKGQTDEMLSEVNRGFRKAYDNVHGHTIEARLKRTIADEVAPPAAVSRAVGDPNVLVGEEVRLRVERWLTSRFKDAAETGTRVLGSPPDSPAHAVDSAVLLTLRSDIRDEARRRSKSVSTDTQSEGEMLRNAADEITGMLEDQLPEDVVTLLQATDSQYRQFKTVENASVRSQAGLTAASLQQAIRSRESVGKFARGDTGELGRLAEQGVDVAATLRKKDVRTTERIVRNMTTEEKLVIKSDFTRELAVRAEGKVGGATKLKGASLLDELKQNREVLKAAGFDDADFARIERIGKELQVVQTRTTAQVDALLNDDVGTILRLTAAIAGSKAGTRALKLFGGASGAGPSLILAQFGSRELRKRLKGVLTDKADLLIRAAMDNQKLPDGSNLYEALLTTNTASIKAQADAARVLNAWALGVTAEAANNAALDDTEGQ